MVSQRDKQGVQMILSWFEAIAVVVTWGQKEEKGLLFCRQLRFLLYTLRFRVFPGL